MVADALVRGGFGTLLFDLLTPDEEAIDVRSAAYRFDIPLLGGRLTAVTDWVAEQESTRDLNIGYFGASTGAAAALIAAANRPERVDAVVSRGGRPDLALESLHAVRAPTLLIVGGRDEAVIEMNRSALARLSEPKHLAIVPGATHLFEEHGTLERVVELALEWFTRFLTRPQPHPTDN
jgi:dienelactone hydrolase